jgi:hypothetical protein
MIDLEGWFDEGGQTKLMLFGTNNSSGMAAAGQAAARRRLPAEVWSTWPSPDRCASRNTLRSGCLQSIALRTMLEYVVD